MLRISFLTLFLTGCFAATSISLTNSQQTSRAIVADDFTKARPKSKRPGRIGRSTRRTYRPSSTNKLSSFAGANEDKVQLGVTIWKLQPKGDGRYGSIRYWEQWMAKRVEADTEFREGDLLRLSIESPRPGYLYIVNRDLFSDGSTGETNLIFPRRGENNKLEPGRLIDIPAQDQAPFTATPKPNQTGESLIVIVTTTPLSLPSYERTLPVSDSQLMAWKETWDAFTERLELNGGAGAARTLAEQQAASPKGARQLTRDDPGPQTIFLLTPRSSSGFLFNLMLSYIR